MSKALTIRNTDLQTWQTIQSIAPVITTSRMFGVTEQQAAIVMLKGHELGLGLATAFEFIDVIDGKPSVKPKGAIALIQQSGELAGMKITEGKDAQGNPNACTVWMKRKNGFEFETTFTLADAERAGLIRPKGGWEKYPANMLRWRAIGYVADIVFPDVIGGMYRPEELGAIVNADGDPMIVDAESIIDAQPVQTVQATPPVVEQPTPPAEQASTIKPPTFAELVEKYGPEAILAANEGRIPATEEELIAVERKLEAGIE